MSLNQLINPVSTGLNLNVHNVTSFSPIPLLVPSVYTLNTFDLQKQQLLIIESATDAITISMPTFAIVNNLLKQNGDCVQLIVKYRTSGVVTISCPFLFLVDGSSYRFPSSNGVNYLSYTIGVAKFMDGSIYMI